VFGFGCGRHTVISVDDFMALAIIRKEQVILVCELAATNVLLSHSFAQLAKLQITKDLP
jgi:hypothetical protein